MLGNGENSGRREFYNSERKLARPYSASTRSQRPQSSYCTNSSFRGEKRHMNNLLAESVQARPANKQYSQDLDILEKGDEQSQRTIWRAFGQYISKMIQSGRGVDVPRFGHFTFTATEVSLAGTTNPQARDKQWREPLFMVGKDFVSAVKINTGISCNQGTAVRPHAVNGASGIIPKVKINYVEVGLHAGYSKDCCRRVCEEAFRKLSDRYRKGDRNITLEIPMVGRFLIKGNVAAINFNANLIEASRGATAKQLTVGNLFSNSNATLNMNIALNEQIKQSQTFQVRDDGANWLKDNLQIEIGDLSQQNFKVDPNHKRLMSAKVNGRRELHSLSEMEQQLTRVLTHQNLNDLNGRNIPASTGRKSTQSKTSRISHTTSMASHMSILPNLDSSTLMSYARMIFGLRRPVCDYIGVSKYSLRDTLSSTQLYQVLKRVGLKIQVQNLKCLLRELGFKFNGPAASFALLFSACKAYIHGIKGGYTDGHQLRSSASASEFSTLTRKTVDQFDRQKLIGTLRDMIYTSNETLYDLFKEGAIGGFLDLEGFVRVCSLVGDGQMSKAAIEQAWQVTQKNKNGKVSFQTFEEQFKSEVPTSTEFETKVIRNIRKWMYNNRLSSEMAFDTLCRSVGRFIDRTMSRASFHKACMVCEVGLTAAQIDALFVTLSSGAGQDLDLNSWQSRIYEDGDNPLQMLREIVVQHSLTQDDLLFQMKLRVWSEPLEQAEFIKTIHNLDQSISEDQIRALFRQLRNKKGLVEVPELIRNLTGQAFETVDFRNKIFKMLYTDIFPNKEDQLVSSLQEQDTKNHGRVNDVQLLAALNPLVKSVSKTDLERFVRFLEKDKFNTLNYMDFVQRMCKVSNRNHNPFRSIISRIQFFLSSNNISIQNLLKRLGSVNDGGNFEETTLIPNRVFAEFLKQKVEKKRSIEEIEGYTSMLDVDKDGYITDVDITTCIKNLNNAAFYKGNGKALASSTFNAKHKFFPSASKMSRDKALEVCRQIRNALAFKQLQYKEVFETFDLDKDGMVSYAEFARGLEEIITLSIPIKEQLFSLMDKGGIGLISYKQFLDVLRLQQIDKSTIEDNFDWEHGVINHIKEWIVQQNINVEEAFKCFDKDFDGFVSKDDLLNSLTDILGMNPKMIQPTKLDRLYRIMDFFKTGLIQMSDFQRLISDENPYATSGAATKMATLRTLGGLQKVSTFDWKFSAIQQMGLHLSKNFSTLDDSFNSAAPSSNKIRFDEFKSFVETQDCFQGLNLTEPLLERIFSELDPHKKGFLNINDWKNAFKAFVWKDQLFIELKNIAQSTFKDSDSLFQFFLSFSPQQSKQVVNRTCFEKAVSSLTGNRFKKIDMDHLWYHVAHGADQFGFAQFRKSFEGLAYHGMSVVQSMGEAMADSGFKSISSGPTNSAAASKYTIKTQTSSSSQWDNNIIEKLRVLVTSSSKTLAQIFQEFDEDSNGFISAVEFRNAIRKLGIGLSSRDIDAVLAKIDTNADGCIEIREFMNKFKATQLDERMQQRTATKMAKFKQLMNLHMTSANDAFRFFDAEKTGQLSFLDFNSLVVKVYEVAHEACPVYLVVKDMFDSIDIRKDGVIDLQEWQQSFGRVAEDPMNLSVGANPYSNWENSREFEKIGALISKNRKQLRNMFKAALGEETKFTFKQGKEAIQTWIQAHFKDEKIGDNWLKCIFKPAQEPSQSQQCTKYDYLRLLEIYRSRHSGPQI